MNRFLARTLSALNVLLALIIIAVATASGATGNGHYYYFDGQISVPGAIFGAIAGIFLAALVCGTIAFLTLIERHLSVLAEAVKRDTAS
ncbi:hypothetical protein [Rhizobium paknamense]|uniref:Nitric oxide reductase large subunit n=1 Tax=Rhizobium paknamense TaxID=1206817 RepID=A0ABU0IC44_9HYPH|nr:hypothetical protein [Rhizobium paknamense]MDQ0454851.1 nitric oxide reductase large subunit [Rhizobium paknamense]